MENTKIRKIVALPRNVFVEATVDTTLIFAFKEAKTNKVLQSDVRVKLFDKKLDKVEMDKPKSEHFVSTKIWSEQKAFLVFCTPIEIDLLSKMQHRHKKLFEAAEMFYGIKAYQVGKGSPPQSKGILDTKPFTSERKEDNSYLPFYTGRDIGRYELFWSSASWLRYGPWLAESRTPKVFEGEKLLIRKIVSQTLIAMYTSETSYCNTLLYVLKLNGKHKITYKHLLGILNSNLIGWYFRKKFQISYEDTFPQIMIGDILQFPIPEPSEAQSNRLSSLVNKVLSLHEEKGHAGARPVAEVDAEIRSTDAEIDALVYRLYDLTDEEIKIVEGAAA